MLLPFLQPVPDDKITLLQAIQQAQLTGSLKVCLDAGDSASYTSGQSWLDRSGNGYDFFRGVDNTAAADDPTFNGSAGGLSSSEYWSFDGGDLFLYDSAQEAWMNTLHKDNAIFSCITAVYAVPSANTRGLFATYPATSTLDPGCYFNIGSAGALGYNFGNGSDNALGFGPAIKTDAWNFFGMSLDEANNSLIIYGNGSQVAGSGAYTSPLSTSSGKLIIGARFTSGTNRPLASGDRMALFAMWQGVALTKAHFDTLFGLIRPRFAI